MATSESTTQQSAGAQPVAQSSSLPAERPKARRLTVSSGAVSGGEGSAPCIRLLGRWLEEAGFSIGSKVDVSVAPGRLVIDTAPLVAERKPRLPRHAQKLFF
jgi:toxic protein SymE